MGRIAALVAGCASTQGHFSPAGEQRYPALATDQPVDVFRSGQPVRPYVKVARLDAHLEKVALVSSSLDEALTELKKQARLAGAHAIIDIREQRSQINETKVLHVTATAVRYTDVP
jgi:hypothetical protein